MRPGRPKSRVSKQNGVGKFSMSKVEQPKFSRSPVSKTQRSLFARSNRSSTTVLPKRNSSHHEAPREDSRSVVRCIDSRNSAGRRAQIAAPSDHLTEEEFYRVKMQQQRRKAKEQMALGNALTTNHGEIMG
ncbi:unnamed protein product [Echinostoma caproni]|uniref:Upf2 domain-containing protein n=1 Tax=Echinostoma caproni TaxID=27848 RepID=A0A183BAJ2_9TREM|nr:unnamed protein product [Echinostoma caproni]